ncbi:MAG: Gfo/Idh/MocA family oxidoreductase [Clostridia bacterium]|nr:Gfo/Idh/MocA family oxidoreductase [Clostridia bacterium]
MDNKIVKLGVIGLGRGLHIVREVACDRDVKITAICDRNTELMEEAKYYLENQKGVTGFECFDNFDDFLKADTDAVVIATDAIYHVPFVIKALDAGKHVLSEIPAVNSLEEAKMLKKAVMSHPNLKYMAGENDCYLGFIQAWKKMYEEGKFGETVYAEAEYFHSTKDYKSFKKEDYKKDHWRTFNPAIKYLTHDLGPLLQVMNDKVVSVNCLEPDVVYNPYKEKGSENAVALFKTAKGAVIRILICFGACVGATHNYRLYGTRGSIVFDQCTPRPEAHCFAHFSDIKSNEMIEIPITCSCFGDGKGEGHLGIDRKMMRDFIECIKNDTPSPIDVDLAIRMSLPGIYAHESALQNGAPVAIPDVDDMDWDV